MSEPKPPSEPIQPIDPIQVPDEIRDQLRAALLDEKDLVEALRHTALEEVAGQAGHARCVVTLTVRRPLDPETAEVRRVEVFLRAGEAGWRVDAVQGLAAGG
jgi:hypothetical protein